MNKAMTAKKCVDRLDSKKAQEYDFVRIFIDKNCVILRIGCRS
ncbi:MAG: hypothetical protein ACJAUP_003484 [Cellvibrionaceae bacterium]|jgi:hypothetical protein